jgi:branched-chain amino acid aminotransferase
MPDTSFPFAYFENRITPIDDARVSIMTNALQYGTGVFGGIRGYYREDVHTLNIFRPFDHFDRMLQSLSILGVSLPHTTNELVGILTELTKKNKPTCNTYYRPFSYAGSTFLSPNLHRDHTFTFSLYMLPLNDYLSTDKGLSAKVTSWRRISDNAIPARGKISGGYINSALSRKEAEDDGYDEAIVLTESGNVSEGSAENIFIVKNHTLVTPPVSDCILEGITRKTVMTLASKLNIPVIERSVNRTELYTAEEAFFCGTGVQVAWISRIDARQIGNGAIGSITKKIQSLYFDVVTGHETVDPSWILSIPTK